MFEKDKKKSPDPKIEIVPDAEDPSAGEASSADASDEELREVLDGRVAKLQADLNEMRQTMVRRQADFENARKRMERERADDSRRITAHAIERFLPVLDALERALAHKEPAYEEYRKGFELIQRQFLDTLKRLGAEPIDALGKPFDPHLHQAIERVDSTDHEDGTVLEVLQPGYLFHGKVLRPATVRVAVHPSGVSSDETSSSKLVN
ncbi:MAG TPA: nucleotide exchange factor GrpE [Candidatus Acidoferrales bacterium]